MTRVKRDLIDLGKFYSDAKACISSVELLSLCRNVITNSVGTQINKDRFDRLLETASNDNKMIKLVTDYALSGQGLGVVKT